MTDIASFVVSDIHGEYELFIRLLEEIHLKETDTLYVLGDILDRGPHPIQIILKLMEMPNVVCLTGNHELMALECLEFLMQEITEISIKKVDEKMLENLVTWQYNGSKSTIDEFRTLSREMQYEVIDFIIRTCYDPDYQQRNNRDQETATYIKQTISMDYRIHEICSGFDTYTGKEENDTDFTYHQVGALSCISYQM